MRKTHIGVLIGMAALGCGLCIFAAKKRATIRPRTLIGTIYVGNVSNGKAEHLLQEWWGQEVDQPIVLKSDLLASSYTVTPAELGISLDITATLKQAPRASIFDAFRKVPATHIAPVLVLDSTKLASLKLALENDLRDPSRAKVMFLAGHFDRQPERGSAQVDSQKFEHGILLAILHRSNLAVPFDEGKKRVTDDQLSSIKEIESEFTTHFPTYKKSRCSNIQLASSKLNGIVLMPGESVSFNDTVGRRTEKAGFQIAGVYKNGKHDFDVGGGICQVSTTLYNAALLADLKIVERHNHSMPVAYVPLGRDATVDYGALDLEIKNTSDHPIAINSEFHPGKLTFRILGKRNPSLSVKIETDGRQRWDAGTQIVVDPSLAPGRRKVVDKGASGEQINSYRLVYIDGKLKARESLGKSYYKGGQRIIAVGKSTGRIASSDVKLVSADSH